jgi:hypothetical protein
MHKMRLGRALLRILGVGTLLVGGVFALSACDKTGMTDAEFEQLCKAEAHVKVLDPVLWERYVQLATENSPRVDKRPGLVELDGYSISYGPTRSWGRDSFELGIHDDKIYISHSGIDVAIIFDKVMVWGGFDGYSSQTCFSHGLDQYPVRGVL